MWCITAHCMSVTYSMFGYIPIRLPSGHAITSRLVRDAAVQTAATSHYFAPQQTAAEHDKRNKQLYGAILSAMPIWLTTSLHLLHRADGISAITFLKARFDATDANDLAAALAAIHVSHINPRNDISEDDLRTQIDSMLVANAQMVNSGGTALTDAVLIPMFDNTLPTSYSTLAAHDSVMRGRARALPFFRNAPEKREVL